MSEEHWLNPIARRVAAVAEAAYAADGNMAMAIRAASIAAHAEARKLEGDEVNDKIARTAANILHCGAALRLLRPPENKPPEKSPCPAS